MENEFIVKTKIDANSMRKSARDLKKAIEGAVGTATQAGKSSEVAIQKATNAVNKQTRALEKQRQKIEELKREREALMSKGGQKETQEYKEVLKFINETEKALVRVQKAREKYIETGGKTKSKTYKGFDYEEAELEGQLLNAKGEALEMIEDGRAFERDPKVQEYTNKIIAEEQKLSDMNEKLGTSYDELAQKQEKAFQKGLKEIKAHAKNVGGALKSAFSGLERVTKVSNRGLKNVLMLAVGARGVFTMFMKLKSATMEGINNLAVYSKDFNNQLSKTKSLFTQLKNSLGTAFAPMIEAMLPTINNITERLIEMSNGIANFFAVLNGQSTYTKAIAVNEDYAKSLGKVNNGLASFDKLNLIGSSGKTSAKNSFTTAEAQAEVNRNTQRWVDIVRRGQEVFARIKAYITDEIIPAFEKLDGIVLDVFDGDWDKVGEKIGEFVKELPVGEIVLNIAKFSFKVTGGITEAIKSAWREILPISDENGIGSMLLVDLCTALSYGALTFTATGNPTLAFGALIISLARFTLGNDERDMEHEASNESHKIVRALEAGLTTAFATMGLLKLVGGKFSILHPLLALEIGLMVSFKTWLNSDPDTKELMDSLTNSQLQKGELAGSVTMSYGITQRLINSDWFMKLISKFSIPKHATGAVVPPNAPYLAMLGDNKRETEVVSPLSTMKKAMSEVMGNQTYTFIAQLDGNTVFESVVHQNDLYKNRNGGMSRLV